MTRKTTATLAAALALAFCLALPGCGPSSDSKANYDLAWASSTVVQSTVQRMVNDPDAFTGAHVTLRGYYAPLRSAAAGAKDYVYVAAAQSCCSQGVEFTADEVNMRGLSEGDAIVVDGIFEVYNDQGHWRLKDSTITAG